MLSSEVLLARLDERGVKKVEVARLLNISPSQVTLMYQGRRRLLLDEAVRLADHFDLVGGTVEISEAVARLLAAYAARQLAADSERDGARALRLAQDLRHFFSFAAKSKTPIEKEHAAAFLDGLAAARSR